MKCLNQNVIEMNNMKKSAIKKLSSFVFIISFLLTACQSTPNHPIVKSKNENHFEAIANGAADDLAEIYGKKNTNATEEIRTESISYMDQFPGADDDVSVSVDVKGIFQTNHLPVIRVVPKRFSMKDARRWAETLSSGNHYYEPKRELTKREIENYVLDLKKATEDRDRFREEYGDDETLWEETKKRLKDQIEQLSKMYENAPESDVKMDSDWAFHPAEYYDQFSQVYGEKESIQDLDETFIVDFDSALGTGRLSIINYQKAGYYRNSIQYLNYSGMREGGFVEWDTALEHPTTLSEKQAVKLADDTLKKLGVHNMTCTAIRKYGSSNNGDFNQRDRIIDEVDETESAIYVYDLAYNACFGGVNSISNLSSLGGDNSEYGARYDYEALGIVIVNDQIFMINWIAPLEVVEIENDNVATITFEEICKTFRAQMQIEYTKAKLSRIDPLDPAYYDEIAAMHGVEIHVDDLRFGLIRIQIPNNNQQFRLVPAWQFRGKELIDYGDGCDWINGHTQTYTYLTINAVDGTIIDVSRGY